MGAAMTKPKAQAGQKGEGEGKAWTKPTIRKIHLPPEEIDRLFPGWREKIEAKKRGG
jgi:hypothetical protein